MSNLPPGPPTPERPPWQQVAPSRPRGWPAFASLVIALIALAIGLLGWFRPVPHNNQPPTRPTYTEKQTADAKEVIFSAFGQVDRALGVAQSLGGNNDPTAILSVATSTRQVLDFGSRYLSTKLAEEPATPSDLATAARKRANAYQELLIGYLDGFIVGTRTSSPELTPR